MPRTITSGARTLTCAALLMLSVLAAPASAQVATCDRSLSPGGSVQNFVDSLAAGETGCLRGGTYVEAVKVSRPNVRLTAYPGERATLQGRLWVAGDGVVIEGLNLNGKNSSDLPSPSVTGDNTVFRRNDVTNDHTSICFSLGHPGYGRAVNTLIENNRIHNCGKLPAANHDHGIYITAADDTRILGNWIYENADRGIQIYPDAQRSVIRGNVIDSNGQGIIFGGEGQVTSNDNVVEGNVITNSKLRDNVESFYPAGTPIGSGNRVARNCVNGGARDNGDGGISAEVGFNALDNTLRDPAYVNRAGHDYRLAPDSPCLGVLADHSVPGVDYVAGQAPPAGEAGPAGSGSPSTTRLDTVGRTSPAGADSRPSTQRSKSRARRLKTKRARRARARRIRLARARARRAQRIRQARLGRR